MTTLHAECERKLNTSSAQRKTEGWSHPKVRLAFSAVIVIIVYSPGSLVGHPDHGLVLLTVKVSESFHRVKVIKITPSHPGRHVQWSLRLSRSYLHANYH
jgi:hypothetical protein